MNKEKFILDFETFLEGQKQEIKARSWMIYQTEKKIKDKSKINITPWLNEIITKYKIKKEHSLLLKKEHTRIKRENVKELKKELKHLVDIQIKQKRAVAEFYKMLRLYKNVVLKKWIIASYRETLL